MQPLDFEWTVLFYIEPYHLSPWQISILNYSLFTRLLCAPLLLWGFLVDIYILFLHLFFFSLCRLWAFRKPCSELQLGGSAGNEYQVVHILTKVPVCSLSFTLNDPVNSQGVLFIAWNSNQVYEVVKSVLFGCPQELERLGLGEAVDLFVCEVPVEYQAVQRLLPSLWKERQPQVFKGNETTLPPYHENLKTNLCHLCLLSSSAQLVVHVGVSGLATTVTLEQCGHNKGYKRLDNCSFCPASQCCMERGPSCISSVLDMETVCKRVNASDIGVAVSVSRDAGRSVVLLTHAHTLYMNYSTHPAHWPQPTQIYIFYYFCQRKISTGVTNSMRVSRMHSIRALKLELLNGIHQLLMWLLLLKVAW